MSDRKSAPRKAGKPAARTDTPRAPASGKSAAPQVSKTASTPVKKAVPPSTAKKAAAVPASPLLAHSPKKTGDVAARKSAEAPKADAAYQPKTKPPALGHNSRKAIADTVPAPIPGLLVNPLAVAAPWVRLGLHMTIAGFAMQARMARAMMDAPNLLFPRTPSPQSTAAAPPAGPSTKRSSNATE